MATSADFESLLSACLSFDNQVRKHAEDALKHVSSSPDVIPALLQRVQDAADPQVRHLAAVLLRKWVGRHWAKLSPEVRSRAQQVLLERIVAEPVHSVRRALADVAASIAHLTVPQQQWQGLLEFLHQCSRADSVEHREVGLLLFAALFETIGEHLQPHAPMIMQALAAGAAHPNHLVQSAALSVIEPLLPYIADAQVPAFHQLLAALLPCAQTALAAGNEDMLVMICQVLVEVAESPAPLLQPCMQQVLEMCMTVATNKQFATSTREQALHLVHWLARYKPKQLTRNRPLLRAIVDALCEMCCEPKPQDYDEADDLPAQKIAAQALDTLAINLNSQHVLPAVWHFVQSAGTADDPHKRAAAMMSVAVLAEGCAEPMRKRLAQLMPRLLVALADPDPEVRGTAAFALGQFSEFLQPDVLTHYEQIIPAVLSLLKDARDEVQERALYALDVFCENLEPPEVLPYMPQVMEQLLMVLQSGSPGAQECCLSAISSMATASQSAFHPYTAQMLPVLHHFMQNSSKEHLQCRCMAIHSAGIIAEALGASDPVIGPHIGPMMEVVLQAFTATDIPDLKDYSHGMFSQMAKVLQEGFAPWLLRVIPLAFASIRQDDGQPGVGSEDAAEQDDFDLDSSEEDSDEDGEGRFSVRTGVLDEKCSATSALGAYADACPQAFMAYAEEALAALSDMCHYWHDEARAAAYDSLQKLALATNRAFPPLTSASHSNPAEQQLGHHKGQAPLAAAVVTVLSQQAKHICDAVLPLLTSPVEDDVNKPAVAAAAAALGQLLKGLGYGAVAPEHLQAAAHMAQLLLQGKALCQEIEEDDEAGDDGDVEELAAEDEELLAAAADILPALAASMGSDAYAPIFFAMHAEPLLARLKPQQPIALRAIAAGAMAEVAEELGPKVADVVPVLLPLLLREMQAEDAINRQNAAYCAGLLVQANPQHATALLPQLLTALHNMFGPAEPVGAQDNAVGAVGRIITALPHALPLQQVLPVLLGALPLKEDLSETTPAVRALCHLLLSDRLQELQHFVPNLVKVFGEVAEQVAAPTEAKLLVAHTLMALQGRYPEQLAPLLGQLPAEQQTALQQIAAAGGSLDGLL